jgi:hypothetical protein
MTPKADMARHGVGYSYLALSRCPPIAGPVSSTRSIRGHEAQVLVQQVLPRSWHDHLKRNFCDDHVWTRFFPEPEEAVQIIADENHERGWEAKCEEAEWRRENGLDIDFALPGSNSALRAATPDNPLNLPCPNCHAPNRLTPGEPSPWLSVR